MSWRLFVALTPPAVAVEHLDAAVAPWRARRADLRWTGPSTWHLTVAFLGDVAEERVPELEIRLARAASRHNAVDLRFRAAGAFARPARATVLYAGVEAPVAPLATLAALAASCAAAGRRIGLEVDDRPYRPHLTLARVKGREPIDVRPVVEELRAYEGPSWSASAIALIRSHLGPAPRYETVASWPLRAPRPNHP